MNADRPVRNDISDEEFLRAFGERVRGERARRGMSRKLLADHARISERYITQLESGKANLSLLLLRHLSDALGVPLDRLVDLQQHSAEFLAVRDLLARLDENELREAQHELTRLFSPASQSRREERIALIGLRGAGKSTIGKRLSTVLDRPFFELDREIERVSGTSLASLLELYGQQAYRRYELDTLQRLLAEHGSVIIATGGSIVAEPATYELLLSNCFTIWVRTSAEEHMQRVLEQGDRRPMAASAQAMDDLRRILDERTPLYARADATLDTSGRTIEESLQEAAAILGVTATTPAT